jgi:hypothetical protein
MYLFDRCRGRVQGLTSHTSLMIQFTCQNPPPLHEDLWWNPECEKYVLYDILLDTIPFYPSYTPPFSHVWDALSWKTRKIIHIDSIARLIYAELVQGTDQPSPPVSCCSNIGLSLSDAVHKPRPPVFEILRPLIRVYNACQTDIKQSERVYIPLSCSLVLGIRKSASITVKDIQGTRGKNRRWDRTHWPASSWLLPLG